MIPGTEPLPEPPTLPSVSYGPHDRHVLDFWQATSDAPTPLVICIHGGGFSKGSKEICQGKYGLLLKLCLASGISVASINCRLRPRTPLWTACHEDLADPASDDPVAR